jgi:hypothetical protein
VNGLDGGKQTLSIIPQSSKNAYLYVHMWNYLTYGQGSTAEFNAKASFLPSKAKADGSFTLKSMTE